MTEEEKKKLEEDTSPKLAKPDSPAFRAHYAQKRRKKRKERNEEII